MRGSTKKLTGVLVKTPRPRNDWASKPCMPALNAAGPAGPASGYVSFCSGASDMYSDNCGGTISMLGVTE